MTEPKRDSRAEICGDYCRKKLKSYLAAAKRRFGMDLEVSVDDLSDRDAYDMWMIVVEGTREGEG